MPWPECAEEMVAGAGTFAMNEMVEFPAAMCIGSVDSWDGGGRAGDTGKAAATVGVEDGGAAAWV